MGSTPHKKTRKFGGEGGKGGGGPSGRGGREGMEGKKADVLKPPFFARTNILFKKAAKRLGGQSQPRKNDEGGREIMNQGGKRGLEEGEACPVDQKNTRAWESRKKNQSKAQGKKRRGGKKKEKKNVKRGGSLASKSGPLTRKG